MSCPVHYHRLPLPGKAPVRSLSVVLSFVIAALSAGGAIFAHVRNQQLRSDARWLLERGSAQADEYQSTLDSHVAEEQLVTLDHRQAALDQAEVWQRVE